MKRPIDMAFQAFSVRDLQVFKTMVLVLSQNGLTIEDALKYINWVTWDPRDRFKRFCPECGTRVGLGEVNTLASNQVGGRYRSQWYCSNCGWEQLSRKTIPEVIANLKRRGETTDEDKQILEWEISQFLNKGLHGECPKCAKVWFLHPIDIPKGRANVYGYKSEWFCDECGHEVFLTRTIREEAERLGRV